LVKLRSILQYLGVSTANMEEGSFRVDANISIRPKGEKKSLAKIEVKNTGINPTRMGIIEVLLNMDYKISGTETLSCRLVCVWLVSVDDSVLDGPEQRRLAVVCLSGSLPSKTG